MQDGKVYATQRRTLRIAAAVFGLASIVGFPFAVEAKLETITLAQLVEEADVVLYGRINEHKTTGSESDRSVIAMKPVEFVKNKNALSVAKDVSICNGGDAESVDFYSNPGTYVVFVSKEGRCYSPIAGLNSVVLVKEGVAHTRRIQGQPPKQPVEAFFGQIRALIRGPSKTE